MLTETRNMLDDSYSKADALNRMRRDLKSIFAESMKRIDIVHMMIHALSILDGTLHAGNLSIPIHDKKNIVLIAVGKAAMPMCGASLSTLLPALEADQMIRGIVVGPGNPGNLPQFIQHYPGAHPFPNQTSRDSAEAAIDMLTPLGPDDLALFLISGGASAMFETPIDPLISCEQMTDFYRALVYSGLPITSINILRKHISKIKGGRLAVTAAPAQQLSLVISDVPGKDLDVIGSGPSLPDRSTVNDCRSILSEPSIRGKISPAILRYLTDPALAETPKPLDPAFRRSAQMCLLSNDRLLEQVKRLASQDGYYTEIDVFCDDWDYKDASSYLLDKIRSLRKMNKRVCLISGGELSVKVNETGGIGGRNQHFLLHCAMNLRENDPNLVLLSIGTDGIDGNSPAAGGIVDSYTLARALEQGFDPFLTLRDFDSYSLLHKLGDTIITGPTGNNVRDLRIILSAD